MMSQLPTGTVTFLFTDIEGSTRLAQEHPEIWEPARARHHAILRSAIEAHRGYVFQVIGDAFCAAFHTAGEALRAAVKSQIDLHAEPWADAMIKVRMGIHTGKAEIQADGEYQGYLALSRVQRLMSAGHGGQVLLSLATEELIRDDLPTGVNLHDLGERRLKDLIRPEHIFQLIIPNLQSDFPALKTLDTYRHNLPAQMTSFIGREQEMAEIKQAIARYRLVTLTGSGGTGKTRLSLQVAADALDQFSDGVCFVELASLSDPALIPQTILSTVGVHEQQGKTALQTLVQHLHEKRLLLILDNCEHLIEACAQLADHLLQNAPAIKILASSREALGVQGEMAWHVPSLSIPDIKQSPTIDQLSQYEAVRLFIDRALLVQPRFTVTNDNAPSIAQICFRLDGIPLAIELAAARVKALSVDQIAARLDNRFRLLTSGARTALPRQQTLRAMIDWSYELLSEDEKRLLRRLAVFAGGWTLEAAEQICANEGNELEVLDLLTHLVDKSLVIVDEARFHMLETTRQYAREKLFESGEGETLRDRHLEYFTKFVAEHDFSNIRLISQPIDVDLAINNMKIEQDNLRAALQWAVDSRPGAILNLAAPMSSFWMTASREEGRQWMEKVIPLTHGMVSAQRVSMMFSLAHCLAAGGVSDKARRVASDSLADAQLLGDKTLLAFAFATYASIYGELENAEAAIPYYEQALSLARETGNTSALAFALMDLGAIQAMKGEFSQAEAKLKESLELQANIKYLFGLRGMAQVFLCSFTLARGEIQNARGYIDSAFAVLGNSANRPTWIAHLVEMLGRVQVAEGDLAAAQRSMKESLAALVEHKSSPCFAHGLEAFARLALAENDPIRAIHFLACGEAHLESLTMSMYAPEKLLYDKSVEAARAYLSETEFASTWEHGRSIKIEQAIQSAFEEKNG